MGKESKRKLANQAQHAAVKAKASAEKQKKQRAANTKEAKAAKKEAEKLRKQAAREAERKQYREEKALFPKPGKQERRLRGELRAMKAAHGRAVARWGETNAWTVWIKEYVTKTAPEHEKRLAALYQRRHGIWVSRVDARRLQAIGRGEATAA